MARANAEAAGLAGRRDGTVLPLVVDLRGAHRSFGSVQAVLHRPHRLNGAGALIRKDLPLNATCPTARIRLEELT